MTGDELENAKLTLKNDGEFYRWWCDLFKNYAGCEDLPSRCGNLIARGLTGNRLHYGNAADREKIRLYLLSTWEVNHVQESNSVSQIQTQPKKEIKMASFNQSIVIKTVTYLNNTDISTLTSEQLLEALVECEKDLAKFKSVTTQNKTLTAKIASVEETIEKLRVLLDK